MYLPLKKFKEENIFNKNFFLNMALYIKSVQLKSGAIPSNCDGSHDPWDHIESIIGLNFAKALSLSLKKPFIAVNHLEGHALSPKLNFNIKYPYLLF